MKTVILIMTSLLLNSCSTITKRQSTDQIIAAYRKVARQTVKLAESNGGSGLEFQRNAQKLLDLAMPILKDFGRKNPPCNKLLRIVAEKAEYMKSLSLERIEHDYHDGEALPEAPARCEEAKELVVHPATVHIIGGKKIGKAEREQIVDELTEVLVHLDMFLQSVKKP